MILERSGIGRGGLGDVGGLSQPQRRNCQNDIYIGRLGNEPLKPLTHLGGLLRKRTLSGLARCALTLRHVSTLRSQSRQRAAFLPLSVLPLQGVLLILPIPLIPNTAAWRSFPLALWPRQSVRPSGWRGTYSRTVGSRANALAASLRPITSSAFAPDQCVCGNSVVGAQFQPFTNLKEIIHVPN